MTPNSIYHKGMYVHTFEKLYYDMEMLNIFQCTLEKRLIQYLETIFNRFSHLIRFSIVCLDKFNLSN